LNSPRLNNPSLKYKRLKPSGFKDIGIRKFECLTKTHKIDTNTVGSVANKAFQHINHI